MPLGSGEPPLFCVSVRKKQGWLRYPYRLNFGVQKGRDVAQLISPVSLLFDLCVGRLLKVPMKKKMHSYPTGMKK